ncbi:MAG: hypothetical protein KJO82_15055 [Gammaproteobacteria bacterium]|nr:hypothetical protein [Gammaproteobacteria bacterium]
MNFVRLSIGAICLALLAACASSSLYAPARHSDDVGYYTSQISDDRFRVTFNGRSSTGSNTVKDYALLRAAELTTQEGYDWFQIVDRETQKTETVRPRAQSSFEQEQVIERGCGLLGCTTTRRPRTTTIVGIQSGSSQERYSSSIEIVMGDDPMPTGDATVYDADELASSLRAAM